MRRIVITRLSMAFILLLSPGAMAGVSLESRIAESLSALYPGARIELLEAPSLQAGQTEQAGRDVEAVTLNGEASPGVARFSARLRSGELRAGTVQFAALQPAHVALRRVFPGEKLKPEGFRVQDVNVALGQGREYRGVLLPASTDLAALEARQSVLEGQFLISSGVQLVPDVRRGDPVRIRLVSGGVVLMTSGMATEPAYFEQDIRVTTLKSKRDLVGKLAHDKTVEVTL